MASLAAAVDAFLAGADLAPRSVRVYRQALDPLARELGADMPLPAIELEHLGARRPPVVGRARAGDVEPQHRGAEVLPALERARRRTTGAAPAPPSSGASPRVGRPHARDPLRPARAALEPGRRAAAREGALAAALRDRRARRARSSRSTSRTSTSRTSARGSAARAATWSSCTFSRARRGCCRGCSPGARRAALPQRACRAATGVRRAWTSAPSPAELASPTDVRPGLFAHHTDGWTLHQLRHSAITHLAEAGESTVLLMAKSRHVGACALCSATRDQGPRPLLQ